MILETLVVILTLFAVQGIYRNWDVYRGKRTTFDALPEHLNEEGEIEAAFPDDSQYGDNWFGKAYRRFHKITKSWGAFGPYSRFSWAKWRETPIVLFAMKGAGRWRLERDYNKEQPDAVLEMALNDRRKATKFPGWYLSRIQYWTRWHFAVQWPLQITFHAYWHEEDVPAYPDRPARDFTIKDHLFLYGPIHRDADKVYWLLSFFIGAGGK